MISRFLRKVCLEEGGKLIRELRKLKKESIRMHTCHVIYLS